MHTKIMHRIVFLVSLTAPNDCKIISFSKQPQLYFIDNAQIYYFPMRKKHYCPVLNNFH